MEYKIIPSMEIYDNLKCAFCMDFMENTISLKCSHTYCEKCIQKLILIKNKDQTEYWDSGAPDNTCPTCRIPFKLSDISPVPTLDRLIQNIQFFCTNYCRKVITYHEMKSNSHKCENLIKCTNDKCKEVIPKHKLEAHYKKCAFTVFKCTICLEPFYTGDFIIHRPQCFRNYKGKLPKI